jgi:hypothetical protein
MPHPRATIAIAACAALLAGVCAPDTAWSAEESIEYVGEHLAEVAMDNRFAALPIWGPIGNHERSAWHVEVNAAYARTEVDALTSDGPMFAVGVGRQLEGGTHVTAFGFFDDLQLTSGVEHRPLAVLFARDVPLILPAEAEFTDLAGTEHDVGFGIAMRRSAETRILHSFEWTAGLLWQQITLRDYQFNYRVLDGPDAGTTGTIGYDATYSYLTTFAGIAWPHSRGSWGFTPHFQVAVPLPRYGVRGSITGPGFDLSGDTDSADNGKHFGDPSLTVGLDIAYRPWNMALDVGTTLSQRLLEPVINKGINSAWMFSARWTF